MALFNYIEFTPLYRLYRIDDIEDSWIRKLGEDLGFRDSEIKKMVRWTQDFNDLLDEAYEYINKR